MPEDGGLALVDAPRLQRAAGLARVGLGQRDGQAVLADLHQSGCAKAFLPRIHGPVPEVVFLNTAGGLTGGDRVGFSLSVAAGTRAVGTTQTAERAYASAGGVARMSVDLAVGQGAALDWLPQETILFDRAALERRTTVALASEARLVMCEMIGLGRAAMGETVRRLWLNDRREVRRDGKQVLVEPLRLADQTLAAGPAALGEARAFATVAMVARGAEDAVDPLRRLAPEGVDWAVSGWDGKCLVRVMGPDLRPVKRAVAQVLERLRGKALPRVWQM
ncbi:urease accessory protein UreD [Tabrizicola sp. J26]|uniref:urease accessory protein UreD n=1 Tax=Alitabrizicola rongguiensis TaxID=2909234 RepID=UPI001F37C51C|nr:urease accessory protein UreD [Tabrizicola rongguiensis]MCF1708470.1 urease accessory protein UreD [Tabrizicola rongguiensis]